VRRPTAWGSAGAAAVAPGGVGAGAGRDALLVDWETKRRGAVRV